MKGVLMFSYRYMPMYMENNLSSSKDISKEEIYQQFMVAPLNMRMDMHMLSAMYAPTDFITVMVMGNYVSNNMDLQTKMGVDFSTTSSGFGDMSATALVRFINLSKQSLHGNFGVSLPTGNINQHGNTPMVSDAQLAYPMQLGSGTYDPFAGLTYLGQTKRISWGVQSIYKYRIGDNAKKYHLGNALNASGWGAYRISDYFSCSVSIGYFNLQKINGSDADMPPMMMPLFNAANSGRSQINGGLGVNFYVPSGKLKDLRLAAEVKVPVYQQVSNIQMKNMVSATFGIQYAIGHNHDHMHMHNGDHGHMNDMQHMDEQK